MKPIDKQIVKEVAETLVDDSPKKETTSLEVKNALRNRGYWATQAEVSQYLRELVDEGISFYAEVAPDWQDFNDSPFNVYRFLGLDDALTADNETVTVLSTPKSGDWLVFSYNDPTDSMYIASNVSRNKARAYFEKAKNVPYAEVACSKL